MQDHEGAQDPDPWTEDAPETERDQFISDMLRLVMEIFPGARRTTRDAYTRAAACRDQKGRKTRG
jgi:hypothetical protein